MDDMRRNFSTDEAEVSQQGKNLVIRLKKIDFKVGSARVPSDSMNLLAKVNVVIIRLNSSKVVVEGHTDATGNSNLNQNLSVKRSVAVAKYLKSLGGQYDIFSKGFGESHPIANNETKNGSTMNRRVDIVVTTSNKL